MKTVAPREISSPPCRLAGFHRNSSARLFPDICYTAHVSGETRNIVLAGVPRSGTTLCCNLLNKIDNTVALAEPFNTRAERWASRADDHEAVANELERFFSQMRRRARPKEGRGEVMTKHISGMVPDNGFASGSGRKNVMDRGFIEVTKDLSPDFWLIIKEPAFFTALLPTLAKRLPCYATVRNPLASLGSSDSVWGKGKDFTNPTPVPPEPGNAPASIRYYPALREKLLEARDLLDYTMRFKEWFYERIASSLPGESVIRYEDVIETGGAELSRINPDARLLTEDLGSKNLSDLYDRERMLRIGERLLSKDFEDSAYWRFYDRSEVEAMLP